MSIINKVSVQEIQSYYFFIGTTAEYIKLFPVMAECNRRHLAFKVISTGQNDIQASELHQLAGINKPDIILSDGPRFKSPFGLLGWMMRTMTIGFFRLKKSLSHHSSLMIVHGDTVSTVMGTILGKIMGFKVAHIEAGLRSFDIYNPFPEELDRVIASRFVDYHFCPNQWACNNLNKRRGVKVNTKLNTLFDSMQIALQRKPSEKMKTIGKMKPYFVCVIHRQENLLNSSLLAKLVEVVIKASRTTNCIFILHPLTRMYLQKYNLLVGLESQSKVLCVDRLNYFDMVQLLSNASYLITDGGSNQEESYFLGLPCLILRKCTERIEGLKSNAVLSGLDSNKINSFIANYKKYRRLPVVASVSPSAIISQYLIRLRTSSFTKSK